VNPLGGTMVADAGMGFNPYAAPNPYGPPPGAPAAPAPYGPPPGGYGTPGPAQPGYGTPAQPPPGQGGYGAAAGGYSAPQQPGQYGGGGAPPGYGAPQQPPAQAGGYAPPGAGYGQPPGGYGQPPGGGYGAPGGGGYGAPGGFTPPDPYGLPGSAPLMGMPFSGSQRGPIGKIRNPVMTIVLSMLCFVYGIIQFWSMLKELKAFRGKDDLTPILFFIPILGYIEAWKLNEKVLDAKRMAGVPNAQVASPVLYLFFAVFFLPSDLNEIWQAASGGQLPAA
jgi:hypothetical protein